MYTCEDLEPDLIPLPHTNKTRKTVSITHTNILLSLTRNSIAKNTNSNDQPLLQIVASNLSVSASPLPLPLLPLLEAVHFPEERRFYGLLLSTKIRYCDLQNPSFSGIMSHNDARTLPSLQAVLTLCPCLVNDQATPHLIVRILFLFADCTI